MQNTSRLVWMEAECHFWTYFLVASPSPRSKRSFLGSGLTRNIQYRYCIFFIALSGYALSAMPPMFWRCWFGSRKGIWPVETEWWGWGTGMAICLERGANDLHMVQLMPLHPIISCSSKIQNDWPFWCQLTQVVLDRMPLNGFNSSSVALSGYSAFQGCNPCSNKISCQ